MELFRFQRFHFVQIIKQYVYVYFTKKTNRECVKATAT